MSNPKPHRTEVAYGVDEVRVWWKMVFYSDLSSHFVDPEKKKQIKKANISQEESEVIEKVFWLFLIIEIKAFLMWSVIKN